MSVLFLGAREQKSGRFRLIPLLVVAAVCAGCSSTVSAGVLPAETSAPSAPVADAPPQVVTDGVSPSAVGVPGESTDETSSGSSYGRNRPVVPAERQVEISQVIRSNSAYLSFDEIHEITVISAEPHMSMAMVDVTAKGKRQTVAVPVVKKDGEWTVSTVTTHPGDWGAR